MSDKFTVEIISPDQSVLKEETIEVTIPGFEGEMGVLKNHIPFITFLRPGMINIQNENKEKIFFIEEGTVEFSNNNLLILSSSVISSENFNKDFFEKEISDSEKKINQEEISDKEKYLLTHKIETLKSIN
jgi:ATP synthase F1 epsilon subunit